MPSENPARERTIRDLFWFAISIKGAFAALEALSGAAILFINPDRLLDFVTALTADELSQDPHDYIATHLLAWAQTYSVSAQVFAALYLITHGSVKLFLAGALLKNQLWAYPLSLFVFGLFIIYQVYKLSLGFSLLLILLTIFDLMVIWLIWREWRLVEKAASS